MKFIFAPAGSLVPYLPDNLLDEVSKDILKELQKSGANSEATRVLVQALGAIGCGAHAASNNAFLADKQWRGNYNLLLYGFPDCCICTHVCSGALLGGVLAGILTSQFHWW